MVVLPNGNWVYPDAHCVGDRVYVHGRPDDPPASGEVSGYMDVHGNMHVCGKPEQIMTPTRPSTSLVIDERCVGGVVIRVNGTAYTQVPGSDGRPQACDGRTRLPAH
jgi:hypothetical protein